YAPPGAEAGGIASGPVPRPPAYLRYAGPSERSTHQDGVRDAGAPLGRVYPGHLRPRHDSGSEGGGQDHGKGPDGGAVSEQTFLEKERRPGGGNTASGPFF